MRPVLREGSPQAAPDASDGRIPLAAGAGSRRSVYCDTTSSRQSVLADSLRLHAPSALANARATTSRPPVAPRHAPPHNPSATARDGSGRTVGTQPSRGRAIRVTTTPSPPRFRLPVAVARPASINLRRTSAA